MYRLALRGWRYPFKVTRHQGASDCHFIDEAEFEGRVSAKVNSHIIDGFPVDGTMSARPLQVLVKFTLVPACRLIPWLVHDFEIHH